MSKKLRYVPERSSGTSLIHWVRNHNVGSNPTLPTKIWLLRPMEQDVALLKRRYWFESSRGYNECVNADKLKQHQPNDWVDNGN